MCGVFAADMSLCDSVLTEADPPVTRATECVVCQTDSVDECDILNQTIKQPVAILDCKQKLSLPRGLRPDWSNL